MFVSRSLPSRQLCRVCCVESVHTEEEHTRSSSLQQRSSSTISCNDDDEEEVAEAATASTAFSTTTYLNSHSDSQSITSLTTAAGSVELPCEFCIGEFCSSKPHARVRPCFTRNDRLVFTRVSSSSSSCTLTPPPCYSSILLPFCACCNAMCFYTLDNLRLRLPARPATTATTTSRAACSLSA